MYVRNKSRPEASIAEGYVAEECLNFCARYLDNVQTRENRAIRNDDDTGSEPHEGLDVFSLKSRSMSKKYDFIPDSLLIEQAHIYVLTNCDGVEVYAK